MDIVIVIVLIVALGLIGGLAFAAWDKVKPAGQQPLGRLQAITAPATMTVAQACQSYYDVEGSPDWQNLWDCLPRTTVGEALAIMRRDHQGQIWVFRLYRRIPEPGNRGQKMYEETFERLHGSDQVPPHWRLVVRLPLAQ